MGNRGNLIQSLGCTVMKELQSHQEIEWLPEFSDSRKLLPPLGWRDKAKVWCCWTPQPAPDPLPVGLSSQGSSHRDTELRWCCPRQRQGSNEILPTCTASHLYFPANWTQAKVWGQNTWPWGQASAVQSRVSHGQTVGLRANGPGEDFPVCKDPILGGGPSHIIGAFQSQALSRLFSCPILVPLGCWFGALSLVFFWSLQCTLYLKCHILLIVHSESNSSYPLAQF